jgi:hypothetical protein
MYDANTTQFEELIWRRLEDPIRLFGLEVSGWWWLALLIPVSVLAITYVILMYRKDSQSIGWSWATLLGLLRCAVYALLIVSFLLPARQTWEESKLHSKVIVVFDSSLSMAQTRDDLPTASTPAEKLPSRQDKVIAFLERKSDDPRLKGQKVSFFDALQQKNPVYLYRFGSQLDEEYSLLANSLHLWKTEADQNNQELAKPHTEKALIPGKAWQRTEWERWLKPDLTAQISDPGPNATDAQREEATRLRRLLQRDQVWFSSTNVGGSVLDVLKREGNNMVQGVVVFSDGRSTEDSPQAFKDLAEIARQKKIPIFAVRVGEDRPKIELEIADLRVPEQARPDDTFPVTVEVRAKGLRSEDVPVYLDVYRPQANDKGDGQTTEILKTLETRVKLSEREPIQGEAKFVIDPAEFGEPPGQGEGAAKLNEKALSPTDKKQLLLRRGQWQFVARVPKDNREIFVAKEHKTEPAAVKVEQKPLRVLLFASAPTREYQFVRTLLVREKAKGRIDLSIYVQPAPGMLEPRNGVVQDVEPKRLLQRFPDYFQDQSKDSDETHYYNLASYDLIVAFDPDWNRLPDENLVKVQKWVEAGGGLVAIGGPINTNTLVRPGPIKERLKPIRDIYPVELQDSRLADAERPADEPWRLNFDPKKLSPDMEFLNLEEVKETKDAKDAGPQDQFLIGWEEFFTGQRSKPNEKRELLRGFFNFYPVDRAKRGSIVLATFADPRGRLKSGEEQPYLVVNPIVGRGKTIWLGSGETWRLRGYREAYHERFWTKLVRYAGSGNLAKQNSRVVPYIGKRFPANSMVHLEAQIRDLNQDPLAPTARPKLTVIPPEGEAAKDDKEKEPKAKGNNKEYKLLPKQTTEKWNGWFEADFPVRAPGQYTYELEIGETHELVSGTFEVKPSNPELDNTSPDIKALYFDLAGDAGDVLKRVDAEVNKELKDRLQRPVVSEAKGTDKADADKQQSSARDQGLRLYFDLNNADLIPRCMGTDQKTQRNRGAVEDLWPGKCKLLDYETSWTMLLVIGLLCSEWLMRKLLRLA